MIPPPAIVFSGADARPIAGPRLIDQLTIFRRIAAAKMLNGPALPAHPIKRSFARPSSHPPCNRSRRGYGGGADLKHTNHKSALQSCTYLLFYLRLCSTKQMKQ